MALPSSYPITLGQVCTEFGAPVTTPLGSFVRGGSYVPNTGTNSGVPTAKPITLGDLLGAAAALIASLSPSSLYGSTPTNNGTATTVSSVTASYSGGSGSVSYAWERVSGDAGITIISPTSSATKFSARCGSLFGSPRSGVYRCKVTRGAETAYTSNVSVSLEYSP